MKHKLYQFHIAIRTIGCIGRVAPDDEKGVNKVAQYLKVTPGVLPKCINALLTGEVSSYLIDELYVFDEDDGLDRFVFSNDDEVAEELAVLTEGKLQFECLNFESLIFSGMGKMSFVLKSNEPAWPRGVWVELGDFAIKLVSHSDVESISLLDFEDCRNAEDEEPLESTYNALMEKIEKAGFESFYQFFCTERDVCPVFLEAVINHEPVSFWTFSRFDQGDDFPEMVDFSVSIKDKVASLHVSPFAKSIVHFDIMQMCALDGFYELWVANLMSMGYTVECEVSEKSFNVGSSYQKLFWHSGQALDDKMLKSNNLPASIFGNHLKMLGATALSKNAIISIETGEPLVDAYSAFDDNGERVATFQIEFYSSEQYDAHDAWIDEVVSHAGLTMKHLNNWEFEWFFEDIDYDDPAFDGDPIQYVQFPTEKGNNILVVECMFICESLNRYEYVHDQASIKWIIGELSDKEDVKAYVTPLLMVPTQLSESFVHEVKADVLRCNNAKFPSKEQCLAISAKIKKDTIAVFQANAEERHRYSVFLIIEAADEVLGDIFGPIVIPDVVGVIDIENYQGNSLAAMRHHKDLEDHYRLTNVKGVYMMPTLSFYDM